MQETKTRYATLTDAVVRELPLTVHPERPYVVRDTKLPCFFCLIGERVKSYYVQFDIVCPEGRRGRKTVKRAIGRADRITAVDARKEALRLLAHKDDAPVSPTIDNVTLQQAATEYEEHLRNAGRSRLTIHGGQATLKYHLQDWANRPLRVLMLSPLEVERRYFEILGNDEHRATARNAMTCLRAIVNYALDKHPLLVKEGLRNPVRGFEIKKPKNRADTAMTADLLAPWWQEVQTLSPIRQYYHAAVLLTGSRTAAIQNARWADIDVKGRRWHIPCPKGGTERAFDIPLSRRLCWLLAKVRRVGRVLYDGSPYVFPGSTGHLTHTQERKHPTLRVGHTLRHTYYSIAVNDLHIDQRVLNALVNHRNGGLVDVYYKANPAELLRAQEQMSTFLWAAMNP